MNVNKTISDIAEKESVNNFSIGEVTAVDDAETYTVRLNSGVSIKVVNASEATVEVDDFVAVRLIGGDINNAEISGKSALSIKPNPKVIWR